MIIHNHNFNVRVYDNLAAVAHENNELNDPAVLSRLEQKVIPAGRKIGVVEYEGEAVLVLETENECRVTCMGFGEGLTSDHWLMFDDGDGKFYILYNEPQEINQQNFDPEEDDEQQTLQTTLDEHPDWLLFLVM